MKKTYKYLLLAIAAIASAACTNLDEEIYSEIPKDVFFSNEEQLIVYSARAYQTLQGWGSEKSIWTTSLLLSDEVCAPINHEGSWDEARYGEIQRHKMPSSNVFARAAWDDIFDGIAACNDVIYEIENSTYEFDSKDNILAEIKILRAYYYVWGMDLFGNIPYSISKEEKGYPEQKDRKFIFKFVEKEINDNLDLLQAEPTKAFYGRVTKGMANTLLAKLYLNAKVWIDEEKWAEAEAACKAVIESKYYSLENNFKDNFIVVNENSKEQIFAIPYSTIYTESDHYSFNIYMQTLSPEEAAAFNIPAGVWNGFVGQPDHFASFEPGDIRRDATWLNGQLYDTKGAPVTYKEKVGKEEVEYNYIIDPQMTEAMFTGRGKLNGAKIAKWEYQTDGLLTDDGASMENDFFIYRYADVVLMYAEAVLRQNKTDLALVAADLKKIRERAGLEEITSWSLENVYNERCHELALEGWKRQDLIRFGKYLDPWYAKPQSPEYALLLPIPLERKNANPNLTQNKGY